MKTSQLKSFSTQREDLTKNKALMKIPPPHNYMDNYVTTRTPNNGKQTIKTMKKFLEMYESHLLSQVNFIPETHYALAISNIDTNHRKLDQLNKTLNAPAQSSYIDRKEERTKAKDLSTQPKLVMSYIICFLNSAWLKNYIDAILSNPRKISAHELHDVGMGWLLASTSGHRGCVFANMTVVEWQNAEQVEEVGLYHFIIQIKKT